ncbi:hypothetical protein ES703_00785 [subsurface metagenome]
MKEMATGKVSIVLLVLAVIAIVAAALVYLEGTKQPAEAPANTFAAFVDAFNARDTDAAYALFSSEVRVQHSKVEMEGFLEVAQTLGSKITGWEVLKENTVDDVSVLEIQITFIPVFDSGVENDRVPMVWEAGEWHIDEWLTEWEID